MTKEKYHHGTLKKEMINKGLQLLNKAGYEGFSLRKIAIMCGVSHAAPYKHFKNKDELISSITLEVVDSFKASLEEVIYKYSENPKIQIVEMGKQYVKFMVDNPDYLKFLFFSNFHSPIIIKEGKFSHLENSPFFVFEKSAMNYLLSINSNNEDWIIDVLTMWSLVHGLSVLIVNKSILYEGDYLDLVGKIVDEKLKF